MLALLGTLGMVFAGCDEASQETQGSQYKQLPELENDYYDRGSVPPAQDLFCSGPSEENKITVEHSFSLVDISTGLLFLSAVQLAEKASITGLESASIDLRDSSNELFELRDDDANLHIKDRQSFLTNIKEGRREALLVLKGLKGSQDEEYCLLLSLQPSSPSPPDGDSSTSDGSPSPPDGDSQVVLLAEQPEFQLPYVWWHEDPGSKVRTVFAGNIPHLNYIGKVLTLTTDTPLDFELVSVDPEAWANFFGIDEETGVLYVSGELEVLGNVFNVSERNKQAYHLSQLEVEYQKEGLPLPEQFVLTVKVSQQEGASQQTSITVKKPEFGSPDCRILDWYADLEGWTEEQVSTFQRGICKHIDYEVKPRGKDFITDQAILNTLPEGLTKPKADYQVIFRDEFDEEGGIEKLDHRLWTARYGIACNQFRQEGGVIRLRVADNCRSTDENGKSHRRRPSITTTGKFEYKYGYIEARFQRVPSTSAGTSFFTSWGARSGLFSSESTAWSNRNTYHSFMCRGNNPQSKRMRWLTSQGVEMQYLEISSESSPVVWWVYHLLDVHYAHHRCHTYPDSRRPPSFHGIHSGLLWATHQFTPEDNQIVIGVEWTPAGYKGFINGKHYKGWNYNRSEPDDPDNPLGKIGEYGYSTNYVNYDKYPFPIINTKIFGYVPLDIPNYDDADPDNPGCSQPGNCIIDRTVSHTYQNIVITMSASPAQGISSENWEEITEIDYIRVFQPRYKYSRYAKNIQVMAVQLDFIMQKCCKQKPPVACGLVARSSCQV